MKTDMHPEYTDATVSCACGTTWNIKSTRKEVKVGICSNCHPFYTGKQQILDTAGRVERFRRKYAKKDVAPAAKG